MTPAKLSPFFAMLYLGPKCRRHHKNGSIDRCGLCPTSSAVSDMSCQGLCCWGVGAHSCILFQELGLGWHWLRSIAAHCVALTGGLQCFGSLSGSQPVFGVTGEL